MDKNYKGIIALDLDGTLLNSDKELTEGNLRALYHAHEAGFAIVPTTGRFFGGMPQIIRDLPFLRYAITVNGAAVADILTGEVIYSAEIPAARAIAIMDAMDSQRVLYDCYQNNDAFMSAAHKARIDEMIFNPHYREMIHRLRKPVPDLKAHITASGRDVQKVQLFMPDNALRLRLMAALPTMFEALAVSSSISENIEINDEKAHKGAALLALADHLGLRREDTYAFGDGLNDLTMLRDAGVGIAMANAEPEAKAAADRLTRSCDEDGVACGIDEILKTI
ncbi:MAG: Cof-type HAD-IIB family hydrolase [Oscillospiraceae bacterium]|nr:Cof-type HAD-IIB family hydrolase [Oscillospiraceae bacterium]